MNRTDLTAIAILALLFTWLMTGWTMNAGASQTIYVDDDNKTGPYYGTQAYPFRNITQALDSALAGDTVFVRAGNYSEHLIIDKTVSLVGESRDSTFIDGGGSGNVVSIVSASNMSIRSFTIRNSGKLLSDSGIYIVDSSGCIIDNNVIVDNNDGIGVYYSNFNTISENYVASNINDGLGIYLSANNVISGNTISLNEGNGIGLYFSSENLAYSNTMAFNTKKGIYIFSSVGNNTICCNNIYSNLVTSESTNVWSVGGEGNYWSYYTGQDANGDGIGDTSYRINADNIDENPLMGAFFDFSVSLRRETYHIRVVSNSTISNFAFEVGGETVNTLISFDAAGEADSVGFCRIAIPKELMNYSFILSDGEEITPISLNASDEVQAVLYFTFILNSHITIISSETYSKYLELFEEYTKLQMNLYNLNATYYELLNELHTRIQSLMYIFAATTAIFIAATIYLSKHAHSVK